MCYTDVLHPLFSKCCQSLSVRLFKTLYYAFPFPETLSLDYHESRMLSGLGGETSSYLAARLITDIEFRKQLKKPRFFVKEVNGISKMIEADIDEVAYYSKIDKVINTFRYSLMSIFLHDLDQCIFIKPNNLAIHDDFFDFSSTLFINHSGNYHMLNLIFAVNANHPV